jgi:hypothetical protein
LALTQLQVLFEKNGINSSTRIVAVYSVGICCYHLKGVGAITKEISIDWLGCAFIAMSFKLHPQKMSVCQRNADAKQLFFKMKGKSGLSANSKEALKMIRECKGLNFTIKEEIDEYCNHFKHNIQMYVPNKDGVYVIGEFYDFRYKDTIHLKLSYETKQEYFHVVFVSEVDKLTHCKVCPKCHIYQQDTSDWDKKKKLEDHIKFCKGKHIEPILKVKDSVPYCPMFSKNKEYEFLFCHNLQRYYKPIREYITFDFETVEQKLNPDNNATTKLLAWILPHTVAASIDKKTTIYYDTRNGEDFIHQFVAKLFEHARLLSQRRSYDKIPGVDESFIKRLNFLAKTREVPILGFNSAKFDMNLFLKHLNCDDWKIDPLGCICTTTNMKSIRVQQVFQKVEIEDNKEDNDTTDLDIADYLDDTSDYDNNPMKAINIVFKDAINYISPTPLANFVKDYGGVEDKKAPFPYEGYDVETADEYFNQSNMFPRSAFHDTLNNTTV